MADKIQKVEIVKPKTLRTETVVGEKEYKPLPSLSLTSDDLPAIKDWKVGGRYKLEVTVEQTSMSQGDEYDMQMSAGEGNKKKPIRARFKIMDIKTEIDTKENSSRQKKIETLSQKAKQY